MFNPEIYGWLSWQLVNHPFNRRVLLINPYHNKQSSVAKENYKKKKNPRLILTELSLATEETS